MDIWYHIILPDEHEDGTIDVNGGLVSSNGKVILVRDIHIKYKIVEEDGLYYIVVPEEDILHYLTPEELEQDILQGFALRR